MEGIGIVLIASVTAVLLYYGIKVVHTVWLKPKALERELRRQGIRGNHYRLLYGDLKEQMEVTKEAWSKPMELSSHRIVPRALPFPHKTVQKYGKITFTWDGTTPRVIVWEPEMMKEILSNKFGHFQKPPVNPLVKLLSKGLLILEGEQWATRRRLINPAFHLEKLKGMVPGFQTSCIDLVKRWKELVGVDGSCELDVWPEFQKLTGDIISRAAFGSSFEEGKRIFQLQKEQAILVMEAARALYLPGFRFIPTAKNRRRMYLDKEIKSMVRHMIDQKINHMKMGELVNDDLLSLMLQFTNHKSLEEKRNDKILCMTIEDVIEECKLFYSAGQETTSVWLTWTVILLSMHQVWQQKARKEVLEFCGKNTPDFEAISQLKIVPMILYEVLRLYPPVINLLRKTYKEMKLQNFSFPAGVELLLPAILFHHDQRYWGENAEDFNPERFLDGVSQASKGQNTFFPFGWGPRICVGMNFAMVEAKMALATILQHFSFELSPSYAHAPYAVLTLQPQFGAQIILHNN